MLVEYVTEDGEVIEDSSAAKLENASKASFKLNLIETVNADPKMRPRHLALICAYLGVMSWPKRRAWLSTSRARAMTGLSESQISPCRKEIVKRGYMQESGAEHGCAAFILQNPYQEDMRQHVAITTEHLRGKLAARQATRRAVKRAVTPYCGDTDEPMSHLNPGGTSHHMLVAISPDKTPQNIALKEGPPLKVGTTLSSYADREDDPHQPYPIPTSEEEAVAMLDQLRRGANLSPGVLAYFRRKLWAGELTPAMVEEQRRAAA